MRFHRPQRGGLLASAAILTAAITAIAVALLLMASSGRGTAEAYSLSGPSSLGAGQTLTINNEAVQLDFISQSAGFNNEFGRSLPGPVTSYFMCHTPPSGIIDGGRFSGPQELRFYLTTPAQSGSPRTWLTGPGTNNSDGFPHARMTTIALNTVRLEWEDLLGGGDQDWNDCIIDIIITPLASLTVCKDVRGDDSGATSWTMDINGPDAFSDRTDILADGGCATEVTLSPGSYTLTETTQPPGYVTSIDCGPKGLSGSNAITFSLAGGESPTCTVYNDTTATFQVFKDFVPDDPQNVNVTLMCTPPAIVTIIDGDTSESDPADFKLDLFSPGATCTATETTPTGYTNTSNCSAVPISPGGNSTCTFTNTSIASIEFCKDVVPNDASTWIATLSGPTPGVSPAVGDGGCHTFSTLAPGSYTLTESGPGGYSPSFSCTNGQTGSPGSVTFTLGAGEQVTCTFTNTGFGSITVCKNVVINDGSDWDFTISGPSPAFIGNMTSPQCQPLLSRAPGNYTVSEALPGAGYQATYNCGSKGSGNGGGVSFNLNPGENVTCTFTNTLTAYIRVCKSVVPANATLWAFTLTGPAGGGATIGNGQCSTFSSRPAGSYTLSEAGQAGYATSYSCDNGKGAGAGTSNTFALGLGEQVTCNFTNAQFGSITIVKDAVPNDAQDFSFTCTGPPGNFQLDDDANGALPNSTAAVSVAPGSYTCSETQVTGWQVSVSCNDGDSTPSGSSVNIEVSPAENVTCTFQNNFVPGEPLAVGGIVGLIDGSGGDSSAAAPGGRSATPLTAVLLGGLLAAAATAAWFARRRLI